MWKLGERIERPDLKLGMCDPETETWVCSTPAEVSALEAALHSELAELQRAVEGDTPSLATFKAFMELKHDIAVALTYQSACASEHTAAAALAMAPAATSIRTPPAIFTDEVNIRGWKAYDLFVALTHALVLRMRGLPLGKAWPAMDEVGAPLASLCGFRSMGEAGSIEAVTRHSTPVIALSLFAAAGSVAILEWVFAEGLVDAQGDALRAKWPRARTERTPVLELMEVEAINGGHLEAIKFLLAHKEAPRLFPLGADAALRNGLIVGVLDADFAADVRAASEGGASPYALWASRVEVALGDGSNGLRRYDEISTSDGQRKDVALLQWAFDRALPLDVVAVTHRLAHAGSLDALKLLHRRSRVNPTIALAVSAAVGSVDVLKWLRSLKPSCPLDITVLEAAVNLADDWPSCQLFESMVVYLAEQECPMGNDDAQRQLCRRVAHKRLQALSPLKALRARGAEWNAHDVLSSQHADVVQFALDSGCALGSKAQQDALMRNAMMWPHSFRELTCMLRKAGCAWPAGAVERAACKARSSCRADELEFLLDQGAPLEGAHAVAPLDSVTTRNGSSAPQCIGTISELSKLGWPWTPAAAVRLVSLLVRAPNVLPSTLIASAVAKGAVFDAGAAAAAASGGAHGHCVLKALRDLNPPCQWDERCINVSSLATWQYAANQGCLWTTRSACTAFERRAARLAPSHTRAIFASQLHRHWLLEFGCPCKGELHTAAARVLTSPPCCPPSPGEVEGCVEASAVAWAGVGPDVPADAGPVSDAAAGAVVAGSCQQALPWAELYAAASAGTLAATPTNLAAIYAKSLNAVDALLEAWVAQELDFGF